jgi:uncharacterized membrane-anchored protein
VFHKYRTKLLAALALAQALFLIGIAGSSYAAVRFGQEVRIRTAPVDPRDMVYGDYVVLNYEISRLDASLWKDAGSIPERGEPVYVVLVKEPAGVYEAAGVYRTRPRTGVGGGIVLKGRVDDRYDNTIRVRYGLEKYYVAERQGQELERKAGTMVAIVNVAPWGQAVLSGLEEAR